MLCTHQFDHQLRFFSFTHFLNCHNHLPVIWVQTKWKLHKVARASYNFAWGRFVNDRHTLTARRFPPLNSLWFLLALKYVHCTQRRNKLVCDRVSWITVWLWLYVSMILNWETLVLYLIEKITWRNRALDQFYEYFKRISIHIKFICLGFRLHTLYFWENSLLNLKTFGQIQAAETGGGRDFNFTIAVNSAPIFLLYSK